MEYLSKEGYKKIKDELDNLIGVEFPKIKDAISEARAQGDLSENYEYRAARRAQSKMIGRIRYLQNILKYSRVIDTSALPKNQVSLLSLVQFTNLQTGQRMSYTIVSPHEMDLNQGKISLNSPIGQALMGRKAGDTVDVQTPSAKLQLRIDSVTLSNL